MCCCGLGGIRLPPLANILMRFPPGLASLSESGWHLFFLVCLQNLCGDLFHRTSSFASFLFLFGNTSTFPTRPKMTQHVKDVNEHSEMTLKTPYVELIVVPGEPAALVQVWDGVFCCFRC